MADDVISLRSNLSLGTDDLDDDDPGLETVPLRTRIINVVKSSPNFTLRPARLSQELGLSVTDASAELCGLLKAVGDGSSFHFEKMDGGVLTMVFVFPPDFEAKALAAQRKDDWKNTIYEASLTALKVLKVLTAFGLILSTLIVSVAGMVALVAAMVAFSRGGGDNRARHLSRQLHNLFIMVRQLLWCYALFGPAGDGDQDPFFREAAYDTSLVLSVCCGNPASLWFWMRAGHLRQRRHRIARGWGRMTSSSNFGDTANELEGVQLIRRGQWGQEEVIPIPAADEQRGLLPTAVEFLFGTTPPGPSESDKWRLRSAVILEKSQKSPTSSVLVKELSPYVDAPPSSLEDSSNLVKEALPVVAHFNGVPYTGDDESKEQNATEAQFLFPELLAESPTATRYDDRSLADHSLESDKEWLGLFYVKGASSVSRSNSARKSLPDHLHEQRMVFTKLTAKQFYHCLLLAILNFVGVIWFAQSLESGGILHKNLGGFGQTLRWTLIPVLLFYAKLFFAIPAFRLCYILGWNKLCATRNERRNRLATELKAESA